MKCPGPVDHRIGGCLLAHQPETLEYSPYLYICRDIDRKVIGQRDLKVSGKDVSRHGRNFWSHPIELEKTKNHLGAWGRVLPDSLSMSVVLQMDLANGLEEIPAHGVREPMQLEPDKEP